MIRAHIYASRLEKIIKRDFRETTKPSCKKIIATQLQLISCVLVSKLFYSRVKKTACLKLVFHGPVTVVKMTLYLFIEELSDVDGAAGCR